MLHHSTLLKRFSLVAIVATLALVGGCAPADEPAAPAVPTVAEVQVTPDSLGADVGASLQFAASVRDTRGEAMSGETVEWTSSEPSIATVSTTGAVTVVSAGTAEIRATSRGRVGRGKVTGRPVTLQSLVLTPPSVSLAAGATQQFGVSGTWSNGSTATPAATYSATGGTISAAGLYTAGSTAGSFRVIAVHTGGTRADTSNVTVVVSPPVLQTLQLSPATLTLNVGATQQFSVGGTWSDGSTAVPAVTYSATGGTISAGGLYTAGGAAGSFRVIASHTGGTRADTSTITVVVPPPVLQTLVLAPASVSLNAGATQQFAVSGTWSNGTTTTPTVTYTATGGTISASGLYTAGNASGSFRVIALHTSGTRADTSAVTVTVTPPPTPVLNALVLTPASVTLNAGATQQFSVGGTWSDGSTTAPSATYSASGGTISASGLYTAGNNAGLYRVIAVHTGGTRADTSNVTVVVPAPPPTGLVNECASPEAGWIWCDDFDVDRLGSYFEVETAGGNLARVSGVGNGSSYGIRSRFTAGAINAGALHLAFGRTPQTYFRPVDAGTANYREVYWRVYVRNQAGWTGGGGDKLTRAMIFASSTSWAQAMIAHVWAGDDNSQYENIVMLDPARGTDASGTLLTTRYNDFANLTWLGISRGTNAIFSTANVGQWHCIEAHVRLNDAGQSNGLNELWVDGALDASRTGINWVGSYNAYGINAIFLENYWNNGSPAAQERYMDNFVVSTQRIGC